MPKPHWWGASHSLRNTGLKTERSTGLKWCALKFQKIASSSSSTKGNYLELCLKRPPLMYFNVTVTLSPGLFSFLSERVKAHTGGKKYIWLTMMFHIFSTSDNHYSAHHRKKGKNKGKWREGEGEREKKERERHSRCRQSALRRSWHFSWHLTPHSEQRMPWRAMPHSRPSHSWQYVGAVAVHTSKLWGVVEEIG